MRKLELFADSRLKEFNLYKYVEQILREGSAEVEEGASIDEVQSVTLFKDFVDLATILDTYQGWTNRQWTNFLTQMMIAFKMKGTPSSINCALAALGIKTDREAVIEQEDGGFTTKITLSIVELDTPNVSKFISRLEELLPRLMWVHTLDVSDVTVSQVNVSISLVDEFDKTMFDRAVRISTPVPSLSSGASNWGV